MSVLPCERARLRTLEECCRSCLSGAHPVVRAGEVAGERAVERRDGELDAELCRPAIELCRVAQAGIHIASERTVAVELPAVVDEHPQLGNVQHQEAAI